MKIINLFKKKDKNYIESINVNNIKESELNDVADMAFNSVDLKNEDRNQILEDGRTLEQTIKDSYVNAIRAEQDSPNPKFHRTQKEQDLSFAFSEQYSSKIEAMETAIYDYDEEVVKLRKSKKYALNFSKEEIIAKCNKEIEAYNKLRKFCYEKGKGGELYFQNMWEYCHYNWNDCFEFIEKTKKYLNELTKEK